MFRTLDVSEWEADELVVAPGRRGKDWLIDPETREYGLFKLPHYHVAEAAAEKVAAELGVVLGVPTARTDLVLRNGQRGIISYKFLQKEESLVDGGDLIIGMWPEYERTRGKEHSFQLVEQVLAPYGLVESMIQLIVLDGVIGNSDRHQDNWSVIVSSSGARHLAPSYDHGSSLGGHIADEEIELYLESERLAHYVARGKSRVGWREEGVTRHLRHPELIQRLAARYPGAINEAMAKVSSARWEDIQGAVDALPDEFVAGRRKALMCDILRRRIRLLGAAHANG